MNSEPAGEIGVTGREWLHPGKEGDQRPAQDKLSSSTLSKLQSDEYIGNLIQRKSY